MVIDCLLEQVDVTLHVFIGIKMKTDQFSQLLVLVNV